MEVRLSRMPEGEGSGLVPSSRHSRLPRVLVRGIPVSPGGAPVLLSGQGGLCVPALLSDTRPGAWTAPW